MYISKRWHIRAIRFFFDSNVFHREQLSLSDTECPFSTSPRQLSPDEPSPLVSEKSFSDKPDGAVSNIGVSPSPSDQHQCAETADNQTGGNYAEESRNDKPYHAIDEGVTLDETSCPGLKPYIQDSSPGSQYPSSSSSNIQGLEFNPLEDSLSHDKHRGIKRPISPDV